jgi:SSS family solute:Na+ symporter
VVGGLAVIGLTAGYGILADELVFYGLLSSLAAYVAASLATKPTDAAVLAAWRERLAGHRPSERLSEPVPAPQ